MQARLPHGFLLALEGIDGAGKSSLVAPLADFCRARGYEVVTSREPTNGPWGQALRASAQTGRLSLEEELELFRRDRLEHVQQVIRPAMQAGKVVILDRYYFSTAAYQGTRGADPAAIIRDHETFAPRPSLTLILDLDPTRGLGRVRARGDRPDAFEHEEALRRCQEIFLSLVAADVLVIDAARPPELVLEEARHALAAALPR